MERVVLLERIKDPHQWLQMSISLRRAADRLWIGFIQDWVEAGEVAKEGGHPASKHVDVAVQSLSVCMMLYAFSLENIFKGYIVLKNPDAVRVREERHHENVSILRVGIPKGKGHSLNDLAEAVELYSVHAPAIFNYDSDVRVLRHRLSLLTDVILSMGRYPTPLRTGRAIKIPQGFPRRAFQWHLRDLVVPVLDHYQELLSSNET